MKYPRLILTSLALLAIACTICLIPHPGQAVTLSQPTPPVTFAVNSAQGSAAQQTATIAAVAGRMNYIEGFDVTGGGATAASLINVTVTGLANTLNYQLAVPAGVTTDLGTSRLTVRFPSPIPASALNTAINVVVPSFGAGNTGEAVTIYGFTQ